MRQRFFFGEDARGSEAVFAGEELIELEVVDDVRGILQEQAALFESFHDQADVALLEVADSAVGEFGAAAGGSFAEVALLEEQDVVSARCGIDGYAHTGGSAAYDDDVPRFGVGVDAAEHFGAVHRLLLLALCYAIGKF